MPRASGQKYWLQDHDSDEVNESPPVQNTWYEVFHAYDVRHIWCRIIQSNDETAAKDIELRWTIDGNVYFVASTIANNTEIHAYRDHMPSTGGTDGLTTTTSPRVAAYTVDKRGLDYKVEIRMTSVPGTNQVLRCLCVRETLEIT